MDAMQHASGSLSFNGTALLAAHFFDLDSEQRLYVTEDLLSA
jgi:hypothetical protein